MLTNQDRAELIVERLAKSDDMLAASDEARELLAEARRLFPPDGARAMLVEAVRDPLKVRLSNAYHEAGGSIGVVQTWFNVFYGRFLKPRPFGGDISKDIAEGVFPTMIRRHCDKFLRRGAVLCDVLVEVAEEIQKEHKP